MTAERSPLIKVAQPEKAARNMKFVDDEELIIEYR